MNIQVKEDSKPQCWYEEEEGEYRVCVRTLKGDYFRTEYTRCESKDAAINLVQRIKDTGHISIPRTGIKPSTSICTEPENDENVINYSDVAIEPVGEKEKPKTRFEFNCDEVEQHYSKIPRYDKIPEDRIRETEVTKFSKYGSVQRGKGVL